MNIQPIRFGPGQPWAGVQSGLAPAHFNEAPGQERAQEKSVDALFLVKRQDPDTHESQAYCWPMTSMPLKVCYPEALDWSDILNQWVLASECQVSFTRTYSAESADIVVSWIEEAVAGRPHEVGHTRNTVSIQGRITHSEIALLKKPLIDAKLAGYERQLRLQATVLHELGHALGLEHSENPKDVMFYRGWQNAYLTEHDCQRIQDLYPANPRLSRQL